MVPLEISLANTTETPVGPPLSSTLSRQRKHDPLGQTSTHSIRQLSNSSNRKDPLGQGSTHSIRPSTYDPLTDSNSSSHHHNNSLHLGALKKLGAGPARFGGYTREAPIKKQLQAVPLHDIESFAKVTVACEDLQLQKQLSAHQILRICKFHDFHVKKSLRMLKHVDARLLNMTAQELEPQLLSKTIVPLPGLQAKTAQDLFYMRPSRYCPRDTPTSAVIANLIYVMDCIYERTRDETTRAMGFIANMQDWTMEDNFTVDYCWAFMQGLQGRLAPCRVELFLIVNPPRWFGKVWRIMKPMLSPSFRRKVHMIEESKLAEFLQPGFEPYLPNEFAAGQASVDDLARDFVLYRRYIEERTQSRKPCPENQALLVKTNDNNNNNDNGIVPDKRGRRHSLCNDSWYMSQQTSTAYSSCESSVASFSEESRYCFHS